MDLLGGIYDDLEYGKAHGSARLRRFPGSHLSAPLTYYPQRLIIKSYVNNECGETPILQNGTKLLNRIAEAVPDVSFTEDPTSVYYQVLSSCYAGGHGSSTPEDRDNLIGMIRVALRDVFGCLKAIQTHHPGFQPGTFQETHGVETDVAAKMSCTYSLYLSMIGIRSSIQRETLTENKNPKGPVRVGSMLIFFNGESIGVVTQFTPSACSVLNYDQWVMLTDTVSSRLLTLITCELNDHYLLDVLPTSGLIRELYTWGDELIKECHMAAYAVIGEYESIVTSIFVTFGSSDPLGLGNDYLLSVFSTADEQHEELGIPAYWTRSLHEILQRVASVNVLSELFGLRKHWGNPMVEAGASGKAVQEKLDEDIPVDCVALMNLLSSFNRMITMSYMAKHHVWPECSVADTGIMYPLRKAWLNRSLRTFEEDPEHEHMHWAHIRFKCNCVTSTYLNQLSYLSDKSVSLPRSELDLVYVRALRSGKGAQSTVHDRRLILEYLRADQLSIMDIFQIVMKGEVPSEWLANSASMKGTELKYLKARIFAVLTYELRQYFAVTEDMIKEHLFPYNPHQTMTMSEAQLLGKLREMTTQMDPGRSSSTLNVLHIIDFSKWNLRMKRSNTQLIFRSIDDFLGYPGLIESTHTLFENMINLVQDPFNPPKTVVEEEFSDTVWRFHNRGWEGQRQKGWTLLTSALLSDMERVTGVHSIICGQGDNQILLTYFPIPDNFRNAYEWIESSPGQVRDILDSYYKVLEDACLAVGLKVKTAETCRSLQYTNYGKRLYFNGVELSMTLKRVSKAMTESNDAFPTTETRLKTSQGASYAAGLYSNPSPWPYVLSRLCTYLILWESYAANPLLGNSVEIVTKNGGTLNDKFISILLKMPSCLGGPPQQPFSAFLCRGHPDPLCEELVMVCLRAKSGCKISASIINCATKGIWFSETKGDKKSLIASPYSLNLKIPTSAKVPLSKAIIPALSRHCKNKQVKSLLSIKTTTYEAEIIRLLSQLEPFNPIIANDIYSRTIAGQRQSFTEGLKNATSLCRLIVDNMSGSIFTQIQRYESDQLSFWVKAAVDIYIGVTNMKCPTPRHDVLAQSLRDKSWGMEVGGVTVPHPLETFSLLLSEDDLCDHHAPHNMNEHLVIIRHSDALYGPEGIDQNRVQMIRSRTGRPYVGNKISEGVISKQVICKTSTAPWVDACRLNVVRNWIAEAGSNLDSFLIQLIKSRTNASLELLNLVSGRPSRLSYSHRASLLATKKSCSITTTSNMTTRLYISSNRMGQFSGGELNFHLPYGPAFVTFQMLVCLDGVLRNESNSWEQSSSAIYHCHLTTDDIPVVYDGIMSIEGSCDEASKYTNPPDILFASTEDLVFENLGGNLQKDTFSNYIDASNFDSKVAYGMVLLGDSLMKEIVRHELMDVGIVNYFETRESSITLGDVKMTGVIGLIRAISISLLLSAPSDIHQCKTFESFAFVMTNFLNNMSKRFWRTVTTPMISMDVIRKLKVYSGTLINSYSGASSHSLEETIKVGVVRDIWQLISTLKRDLGKERKSSVNIYAPNLRAARYLYSRFLEIMMWTVCLDESVHGYRMHKLGRDIASYVLKEPKSKDFKEIVLQSKVKFLELCVENHIRCSHRSIPTVKLFNLNDPWIDRLRSSEFSIEKSNVAAKPSLQSPNYELAQDLHYVTGPDEVALDKEKCSCSTLDEWLTPSLTFLFNRHCRYDRFSSIIGDAMRKFSLVHKRIIIVGDTDAEISLGITKQSQNELVYIAGSKEVTQFDPHTLGSYIPTAFVDENMEHKIWNLSAAALIGNPLKNAHSLRRMVYHLGGVNWDGVVVRIPDGFDKFDDLDSSEEILHEILSKYSSISWVLIALAARCTHELERVLTILGKQFSALHVYQSPIAPPKEMDVVIIGRGRKWCILPPTPLSVFTRFNNNEDLRRFVESSRSSMFPKCSEMMIQDQGVWTRSTSYIGGTISDHCNRYLPGWGLSYSGSTETQKILDDLSDIKKMLKGLARGLSARLDSMEKGDRMVRSKVLEVNFEEPGSQIQQILNKWLRCVILTALISAQESSVQGLTDRYQELLGRSYKLHVGRRNVEVEFQISLFTKVHSPHLFGILGHIRKTFTFALHHQPRSATHFHDHMSVVKENFSFPIPLKMSPVGQIYSDERQKWDSRSKVMGVLFVYCLHLTPIIVCQLSRSMEKWIETVERTQLLSTDTENRDSPVYWQLSHSVKERALEEELLNLIRTYKHVYVQAKWTLIRSFGPIFEYDCFYRIPWTGIVPGSVLAKITLKGAWSIPRDGLSLDFMSTRNKNYSGSYQAGCNCYDCVTERHLLSVTGLDNWAVNRYCNPKNMESVFDMYHLF